VLSSLFVSVVICLHLVSTSSEVALCGKTTVQYRHGCTGHCEEAACGTGTICPLSADMATRSQAAKENALKPSCAALTRAQMATCFSAVPHGGGFASIFRGPTDAPENQSSVIASRPLMKETEHSLRKISHRSLFPVRIPPPPLLLLPSFDDIPGDQLGTQFETFISMDAIARSKSLAKLERAMAAIASNGSLR
jgi:hypothetical protein